MPVSSSSRAQARSGAARMAGAGAGAGAGANAGVVAVTPYAVSVGATEPPEDNGGFQLGQLLQILQRRKRVFWSALVLVAAASTAWLIYQRLVNPVYEGSFTLLITDPVSPTTSGNQGEGGGGSSIGAVALNRAQQDLPTLTRVLESPVVLEPVFQALQRTWPDDNLPSIRVLQDGGASGVLSVQVSGGNRAQLARTLELTQQAYLGWSLQQRRERLQEAVRFLDEQAPALETKANAIQGNVQAFRLRHRLVLPEAEAAATRSQVEGLRNQLIAQQAELGRLERLRGEVAAGKLVTSGFSSQSSDSASGQSGGGSTSVELTVPDQALLAELAKLDTQLAEARSRYVPGTPILQQLERARASLVPEIQAKQLEALGAALDQHRSRIQTTQRQISALESRFNSQPELLRTYGNLEQKLKIAEGNLESYLKAREQFQLEIAQNTAPWKVIAPAQVGASPVAPNLNRGLLQALLLGGAAGVGAALLRDRFDHVFHSPGEVRDELGESLLGHVPYISLFEGVQRDRRFLLEGLDKPGEGSTTYQRFRYQEAFRNLATSLRFLNSDQPVRSIALSSSVPAEGKSLVAVLLAKTLSELGQRVLLVDADLRKPQLHHRIGLDNLSGLSNLLTDEASDWRSCVQPVPNHCGWDVITAGRRPPDPPRLLSSQRMAQLVETLAASDDYDLVIYDTPPALGLADAALVAEQLDGLIMLVSLSRVDRNLPAEAIRRIRQAHAPLLGVVTNSCLQRREGQGDGYGGYGYGGYGYGSSSGYGGYGGYGGYADDPALAYAHYSEPESREPESRKPEGGARGRGLGQRWRRRLGHWLDG